jgi:hypothetical protein
MAAACRSALSAERPRGTIRLGGFCNGALVAFETVRLLNRAGWEVELVAMIDPPTFETSQVSRTTYALLLRMLQLRLSDGTLLRDRLGPLTALARRRGARFLALNKAVAAPSRVSSGGTRADAAGPVASAPVAAGAPARRLSGSSRRGPARGVAGMALGAGGEDLCAAAGAGPDRLPLVSARGRPSGGSRRGRHMAGLAPELRAVQRAKYVH